MIRAAAVTTLLCYGWCIGWGDLGKLELDDPSGEAKAAEPVFPIRLRMGEVEWGSGAAPRPEVEYPQPKHFSPAVAHLKIEVSLTGTGSGPHDINPLDVKAWLLHREPEQAYCLEGFAKGAVFRVVSVNGNRPIRVKPGEEVTVPALFDFGFIPGNGFLSSPRSRPFSIAIQVGEQLAVRDIDWLPRRNEGEFQNQ